MNWLLIIVAVAYNEGPAMHLPKPERVPVASEDECHQRAAYVMRWLQANKGVQVVEVLYDCREEGKPNA